jgi:hypothetical protein
MCRSDMPMLKILLQIAGTTLLLGAAFVFWTPWRVHGGRFATEYSILGGIIAALALALFFFASKAGD